MLDEIKTGLIIKAISMPQIKKLTVSILKADVGSIGGHTVPHPEMITEAKKRVEILVKKKGATDGFVTFTGDDISLIFSHEKGVGNKSIHNFAWNTFKAVTEVAKKLGVYGAGQDLLVDAPAGNLKGAGPAVAEIEFPRLPDYRKAETLLVFTADKCGPGAYNFALWNTFCNPLRNGGLLLSPVLAKGFVITVIDMDHKAKDTDRVIELKMPEDSWKLAALLRNIDRFAVESVHSRAHPSEQIVSVSATRMHNISGVYSGKDDPVQIFRTQGIFPAPEEVIAPYKTAPFITGGARGSHTMAFMPMSMNTSVRGEYCQPIVSCLALSVNREGSFTGSFVDMFAGKEWDSAREHAIHKSDLMREQGFFGVAMASQEEIAYTGLMKTMAELDKGFVLRKVTE